LCRFRDPPFFALASSLHECVDSRLDAVGPDLVAGRAQVQEVGQEFLVDLAVGEEHLAAHVGEEHALAKAAKDEMDALWLFRADVGAFVHLYTFLSQIFDYGNTDIEKRSIFFKGVLPLLEFGREREGLDLSKVVLTHHTLKDKGTRAMPLGEGEASKLKPPDEVGGGMVQEKQRARLREVIEKVNGLFDGELTDQDKLVYVNHVIMGKLLESETLRQQAAGNSKEQFANSPDLRNEIMNAIIGALDAHNSMSKQALGSEAVRQGLKDVLLNQVGLYEALRQQPGDGPTA
jgi:type I restriction enzyme R subunit